MNIGEVLFWSLLASFTGSAISNMIAYWFIKRGKSVLKIIKITTYTVAILMLIALSSLFIVIAGLFGQNTLFTLILLLVIFAVQYLIYPYIFLRSRGIRKPVGGETRLYAMLEELKRENNITKKIDIYVMDTTVPNAFAVGNFLKRAIVVTKGLLLTLNDEEVKAVLAHELGHIVNRDNTYALATSLVPYIAYLTSLAFIIGGFLLIQVAASSAARSSKEEQYAGLAFGLGGLFLIVIGVVLMILSFVVNVSIMAFSRLREHLADMYSVKSLRNTKLADALVKIENRVKSLKREKSVTERVRPSLRNMLYIIPMLYVKQDYTLEQVSVLRWITIFSTHPPTEARIFVIKRYCQELGYMEA